MRRTHRTQRTPNPSLTPLLVQAGAAHTLGSIVIFFSLALLCLGAYLLVEGIRHPLDAQPAEIIGAAVMIALAATMLFYLFEPRTAVHFAHHRHPTALHTDAQVIPTPALGPLTQHKLTEFPFAPTRGEHQDK